MKKGLIILILVFLIASITTASATRLSGYVNVSSISYDVLLESVYVTVSSTNDSAISTTNNTGHYIFSVVNNTSYDITFMKCGFWTYSNNVSVNGNTSLNVSLEQNCARPCIMTETSPGFTAILSLISIAIITVRRKYK